MKLYGFDQTLQLYQMGLLSSAETKEMLGLVESPPATTGQFQGKAFESDTAKARFEACLHACGVQTRGK